MIAKKTHTPLLFLLVFCACLLGCASKSVPKISLSAEKVVHKEWIVMRGEGFTPNADLVSHLKRPNGTEFPELPMLTDSEGKFTHEVDTLLLTAGVHELWVIDTKTNVTSNIAKFEVSMARFP